MAWRVLLQRTGSTALVLLGIGWLFRAAPFLPELEAPEPMQQVAGVTPIDAWAPVEVMVAGLPLESSSRPVMDCLAANRSIRSEARCEGCRLLSQSMDGATGSYLWLEPRPDFEAAPWRVRAELLHCSSRDSTGRRYSYASLPAAVDQATGIRIVPLAEGSEEILRVAHPGWSVTIDRVDRPGVLEAVVLGLRLRSWLPVPAAGEAGSSGEFRILQRGDELCLLSEHRDADETYLMALVQRQI